MTDPKLCGHSWPMVTRATLAVAACVILGCSGSTAVDASTDMETASDGSVSDGASTDIVTQLDGVDAGTDDGTAAGASGWDASAWDGATSDVAVPLDSGSFAVCFPPAGASSAVCAMCETFDRTTMVGMACSVEGLQCGYSGCASPCDCTQGTWLCLPADPCR